MKLINYYELVCKTYHNTPVVRIRFHNPQTLTVEECTFYTPKEITNILELWRMGDLSGSFAIGTQLAENAKFILCQEYATPLP